jgi:hypothetical protein
VRRHGAAQRLDRDRRGAWRRARAGTGASGGIGFPYSLTVAVFGGTAPYLATWLASIVHAVLFPWYVAVLALFGLVVYLRLPETAHRPLD